MKKPPCDTCGLRDTLTYRPSPGYWLCWTCWRKHLRATGAVRV